MRLCLVIVAVLGAIVLVNAHIPQLSVSNIKREIDLTTHLVKITDKITFTDTKGSKDVYHSLDKSLASNVAYMQAYTMENKKKNPLSISQFSGHDGVYKISFPAPVSQETEVTVIFILPESVRPYPENIKQSEKQMVLFNSNLYVLSPYTVESQTIAVKLPSNKIESFTKLNPYNQKDSTITYGPYEKIAPNTVEDLSIHFENNNPFLTVTSMTRWIELSHWGNVAIEDTYDMLHTGAKLQGPFSRFDFQMRQDGYSAVKEFKTILPPSARDVYYRDDIGNISTSALRESLKKVEVQIQPRFPLFGGWKTHYTIGYNMPSYELLYVKGSAHVLQMPLIDHIYDHQFIKELTIKIVLPEGCTDIDFIAPAALKQFTREKDDVIKTYLDTYGRTVLTIKAANLVQQHADNFQVTYNFSKVLMLREPLMVAAFFVCLFAVIMAYVRIDFSIVHDPDAENMMKMRAMMEHVAVIGQSMLHNSITSVDDICKGFKQSKDKSMFSTQRSKLEDLMKQHLATLSNTLVNVKEHKSAVDTARLTEIIKLFGEVEKVMTSQFNAADRLVTGKMAKQAYLTAETEDKAKMTEYARKIEPILAEYA